MEFYEDEPELSHMVDPDPFQDYYLPENVARIDVTIDRSKRSVINQAVKEFGPGPGTGKPVVLIALGAAISTAVSCVENIKFSSNKSWYQNTQLRKMRTIEVYLPRIQGLDPIRVTRSVPMIYILLSKEPLPDFLCGLGFQRDSVRDGRRIRTLSESLLESPS